NGRCVAASPGSRRSGAPRAASTDRRENASYLFADEEAGDLLRERLLIDDPSEAAVLHDRDESHGPVKQALHLERSIFVGRPVDRLRDQVWGEPAVQRARRYED